MKGIILTRGSESRLFPLRKAISRQILPVYDKPLIYYALYTLMMSNIKQIQIIITPADKNAYKQLQELLGDGSSIGVQLTYKIQEKLRPIADIFLEEERFIANDSVALILGDNFFYGEKMEIILNSMDDQIQGAVIFGYSIDSDTPTLFDTVELKNDSVSIITRPEEINTDLLVPGIYFYDNSVIEKANNLKLSLTGELKIMDINKAYLKEQQLKVILLGKENKWFHINTCNSLLEVANFVSQTQEITGNYVGCIEEIAYKKGYISYEQLQLLTKSLINTRYGKYIENITKRQWEWES